MMKEEYIAPQMEIIQFEQEDVISVSNETEPFNPENPNSMPSLDQAANME